MLLLFCSVELLEIVTSCWIPSNVPVVAGLLVFVWLSKLVTVHLNVNNVLPPLTCNTFERAEPVRGGSSAANVVSTVPTVLPPIMLKLLSNLALKRNSVVLGRLIALKYAVVTFAPVSESKTWNVAKKVVLLVSPLPIVKSLKPAKSDAKSIPLSNYKKYTFWSLIHSSHTHEKEQL